MFNTINEFSIFIESKAKVMKISIIDTLLEYCEEHLLEITDIVPMLNRSIKDKIEQEYIDSGMLPRKTTIEL
jgi:hypothetical protein